MRRNDRMVAVSALVLAGLVAGLLLLVALSGWRLADLVSGHVYDAVASVALRLGLRPETLITLLSAFLAVLLGVGLALGGFYALGLYTMTLTVADFDRYLRVVLVVAVIAFVALLWLGTP